MDVTHVPELGRLKYLHVSIDTYSHFIWATPQPGEKARNMRRHLTSCFTVMGVPKTIKTDNGPAYVRKTLQTFLQTWNITHLTGIPHFPTGQAVVERANGTLKRYLAKFKDIADPKERVAKALFVLNHLCIFGDEKEPPAIKHREGAMAEKRGTGSFVTYRDTATGLWQGPAEILYFGYVCVLAPTGPQWIPSRWVKPVPGKAGASTNQTIRPGSTTPASSH
ncbi:PREDICTED: endogenous retrovirus group K member 8 Pol protein-like [Corvus brachyrhynchos]|uniref:endogenous retrovirus group K member 8 Pol protein-like n=1 Tax=Corvus brachyrhynchos TaxID=85066 RepID=UPI0008163326|nr:PREDICTED: endogenous retrovirus group K member 8 Pol protein-like [Corvus brachyrhynchos]